MKCKHGKVEIVNWYELVPKYRCLECGAILICECERTRSARLLPHQTRQAGGPGFRRVPVDEFGLNICHHCRGKVLPPAPRAKLPGQKGKVQRFYWREINRTYYEKVAAWLDECDLDLDLLEFQKQHPKEAALLKKESLCYWQEVHQKDPLYNTKERDQQTFLEGTPIPILEITAPYEVVIAPNGHRLGRFRLEEGDLVSVEGYARHYYKKEGWQPHDCERRLIATLCAVYMSPVYQDPTDERLMTGYRASTHPASREGNPHVIAVSMPDDFGQPSNFQRRHRAYEKRLKELVNVTDPMKEFDRLIGFSAPIRDYLEVHETEINLARIALFVIPFPVVRSMLEWAIQHFWSRQHGWPDLLLVRDGAYKFAEVKSQNDRLSQEQMQWFSWATLEAQIPCEVLMVLPSSKGHN